MVQLKQKLFNIHSSMMLALITTSIFCKCIVVGEQEKEHYLKLSMTPIEDHPDIVARVRQMSDCTDTQLQSIHDKCSSLLHDIIHLTHEYEYGLRNNDPNGAGLSKCERSQIVCFSHPKWKEMASCACLICNHIWPYDEEMHQHFIAYFKDHNCKGNIPKIMQDMQFCDFMNHTERAISPESCSKTHHDSKQNNHDDDIYDDVSSSNNLFYTNNIVIIIWTVIVAITMSLSLYFYYG